MKKILPVLLCYVFVATQAFALSGGPVFGSGAVNPIGTYSGILQGVTETDNDDGGNGPAIPGDPLGTSPSNTTSSNALGLFELGVPQTSVATGAFILFADGVVFSGTITASVDPDSDKISGIVQASFNISEGSASDGTTTVTAQTTAGTASGFLTAKILASTGTEISTARLNGTANLDISFNNFGADGVPIVDRTLTFTVAGFRQSFTAISAATIGTATATGTGT